MIENVNLEMNIEKTNTAIEQDITEAKEKNNPKILFKTISHIYSQRDDLETDRVTKKLFMKNNLRPMTINEIMFVRGMKVFEYMHNVVNYQEKDIEMIYAIYSLSEFKNNTHSELAIIVGLLNEKVKQENIYLKALEIYKLIITSNLFEEYNAEMAKIFYNAYLIANEHHSIILYAKAMKQINYLLKEGIMHQKLVNMFERLIERTKKLNQIQGIKCFNEIKDKLINIEEQLKDKFHVDELYVHGSYARDEVNMYSDVDLIVVMYESPRHTRKFKELISSSIAEQIGVAVDVIILNGDFESPIFPKGMFKERIRIF